ncbi:hydroxymethylglutaryl-CoA reductase [candidate division KSB1 bacterium 4484_87]|nr:MAG: hydroxymethylglutaryl-CoA reductase [candidate division KSB1 bacterium 4484_87]
MKTSRIPDFYQYSVTERLKLLKKYGILDDDEVRALVNGKYCMKPDEADKMIENVVGVFSLPMGLGLNFLINGKEYIVPMVVEEPSIVAAVSSAAKLVRQAGGFVSKSTEPILIGQIQVVEMDSPVKAKQSILRQKEEILNLANDLHPNLVARGGGARDIEVILHSATSRFGEMLVVHLLVDTRDAMGANLVNSMCEGVASLIEKITRGKVFLRILSNLADRSLVRAKAVIRPKLLAGNGYSGEEVREGIILANHFAAVDPYRAATHNKGIMNGIDPVAIATGNDWRAIESGAHAYAARGTSYTSLTNWFKDDKGNLVGTIEIPIKVGTVGGPLQSNPAVQIAHRILGIESANELAEVMGAVGLAQNFAALRALVTEGIQRGHMTLHARSVVKAASVPEYLFDEVVNRVVESGNIKIWKAKEICAELEGKIGNKVSLEKKQPLPSGYGKVILLGEHAVVYGSHAIAAPIPLAIQARVEDADEGISLIIPQWGVEEKIQQGKDYRYSIYRSLQMLLETLDLMGRNMQLFLFPHIPRAMGLGGSAALAVAIIRALSEHFRLDLSDEEVNKLAYESEKIVHGTPSGIDNTMATYGKFILYQKNTPPKLQEIKVQKPLPLVIGMSGVEGLTLKMVRQVRQGWEKNRVLYDQIFDQIDEITQQAVEAIQTYDLEKLGYLMNINQGLLNAIQVSTWELEELVEIARKNGALGAKLTGGGGGGAIIALCPENAEQVVDAMQRAGYKAIVTEVG